MSVWSYVTTATQPLGSFLSFAHFKARSRSEADSRDIDSDLAAFCIAPVLELAFIFNMAVAA